jgi:hypothetical protein
MPNPVGPSCSKVLPDAHASAAEWQAFKRESFARFITMIQSVDEALRDEPHARLQDLRKIRREHHVIILADRIRRRMLASTDRPDVDLRMAAELILDRHLYPPGHQPEGRLRRSRSEETMLTSARVNWHKLMRRAGSRAEPRGGWLEAKPALRGTAPILRKMANPELSPGDQIEVFRAYAEQRLQTLVGVSEELDDIVTAQLPADVRRFVRKLKDMLRHSQNLMK